MQVISAKFENGVFIPKVPVTLDEDQEAVIIISEKKSITQKKSASYFREEAARHFADNFPGIGVSQNLLDLVGILHGTSGKYDREEYHEHVGRKFK